MEQGKLFNLVGTMLIISGTALHIVCLVTPHFSEADGHDLIKKYEWQKINQMLSENTTVTPETTINGGSRLANSSSVVDPNFYINKINFGLWELCFLFVRQDDDVNICTKWSSDTIFNSETKELESIGSKGWVKAAQAMGILEIMVASCVIVIALMNMLIKSKGDRMRLIHIFIAAGCFGSGGFLLLGNLIVAANFKDVIVLPDDPGAYPALLQSQEIFREHSYLSWGFALDFVAFALAMLAGIAHLIGGRIVNVENGIV